MIKKMILSLFMGLGVTSALPAMAGDDAYIGEVILTPFTFCPVGFAEASGQLIPVQQNPALYSLLGNVYGGDGRTNFALPNLNGRVPIGIGQGPGLSPYVRGQVTGTETRTVTLNNLPPHTHTVRASSLNPDQASFQDGLLPTFRPNQTVYRTAPQVGGAFGDQSVSTTGGGQSMTNMQPYLAMRWCISTQGVFPPRD